MARNAGNTRNGAILVIDLAHARQAWLKRLLPFAIMLLAATMLLLAAAPAKADSFYFGYSDGYSRGYPGSYYGPPGHRHRYHGPPRYAPAYWGPPPVYYRAPPRVVYVEPPPRVVYVQPQTQANISAVPNGPVYQTATGQYCREYQSTVMVGGMPQPSYGTACLMPDGVWRVMN